MRRLIGFMIVALVAGCQSKSSTPTAEEAGPKDPPAVVEALWLLDQGKIAEGLDVLNAAIERTPQVARLYGARATLHHRAGLNSEALEDLNRALDDAPHDAQLLNNRGFVHLSLREFDEAIADLDRALDLKPDMASACNNRGLVSIAQQKYQDAVEWFSEALAKEPDYVDAWNNRGFAWMQLGRLENAYADLNQALRISPKYVNALQNRGLVKARAGELADALLDFTDAMMIDPLNSKYYEHRSKVYQLLGKSEESRADLRMMDWLVRLQELNRAVAAQPRSASAWANRGRHYWDHGDEIRAKSDADRALEIEAQCGPALVLKARISYTEKRYDEVLELTAAALDSKDGPAAASVRGDALLARGKYNEALECYAVARRFDASVAEAYYRKSQALSASGDTAAAEQQLDLALELDPQVVERLR